MSSYAHTIARSSYLVIAALVSVAVPATGAQQSDPIAVRVTSTDDARIEGVVTSITPDSLSITTAGGGLPVTLALDDAVEVERLVKVRGSTLTTIIGAVAGAAVGFALVYEDATEECNRNTWMGELCDLQWMAWLAVPATASIGGLAGWAFGLACCTRTKWKTSSLEQVRLLDPAVEVRVRIPTP